MRQQHMQGWNPNNTSRRTSVVGPSRSANRRDYKPPQRLKRPEGCVVKSTLVEWISEGMDKWFYGSMKFTSTDYDLRVSDALNGRSVCWVRFDDDVLTITNLHSINLTIKFSDPDLFQAIENGFRLAYNTNTNNRSWL